MAEIFPTPPPGLNYIESIRDGVNVLLLVLPLAAMLIPVLILLCLFSTPASRRHPIFYLNVVSVLLGTVSATISCYTNYTTMTSPWNPHRSHAVTAGIILMNLSLVFTDSILMVRIAAFYPSRKTILCAALLFPAVAKAVRFSLATVYLVDIARQGNVEAGLVSYWHGNPILIASSSVQMADNIYCTGFFLLKLRQFYRGPGEGLSTYRSTGLLSRVRQLFFIALTNFVFPLVLNIWIIILIVRDSSYIHGAQLLYANEYLNIIMVVFATVWASASAWGRRVADEHDSALVSAFGGPPGYLASETRALPSRDVSVGLNNVAPRVERSKLTTRGQAHTTPSSRHV